MTSRIYDEFFENQLFEEHYLDHYDDYIQKKYDQDTFELDNCYVDQFGVRWKKIPGFSNYEISENGEIKSYVHKIPRYLSTWSNQYGHEYVGLTNDDGKKVKVSVHRLVAMVFIKNPNNDPVVMHQDDNPKNNSIYNLNWGTQMDNMHDCFSKGRNYTKPVYCYNTDTVYRSCAEAADAIGVSRGLITTCCKDRVNSANGYVFCYLEDRENLTEKEIARRIAAGKNYRPVRAINIETGEILIFESRRDASKCLGVPDCSISSCITGLLYQSHGWKFEDMKGDEYYG